VLLSTPGDGMVNLLKLQIALAQFSWNDVLETRLALEAWSVEEAANRSQDDDHRELAEILDRMDDPAIDSSEFNRLDAAFHMRIAESTGNALTAHFMGSLRTAIHRQMVQMYAELEDWRETAKTVRAEHREILRDITSGDGAAAAEHVRRHITDFYQINAHGGNAVRT
jgi:DNA-binding FadR family transcriptional regulator